MAQITQPKSESQIKKGREHYSHAKADAHKAKLREQAEDRQDIHNKLSIAQKIAKAKSRRGESKREIARLEKQAKAVKAEKKALTTAKPVVK